MRALALWLPLSLVCLAPGACRDLAPELKLGEDQEGLLEPGETVAFRVHIPDDSYLYLGSGQHGVDYVLVLRDPSGAVVASSDGKAGPRGQEVIAVLVNQGGEFELTLEAKTGSSQGRFTLWIGDLRRQRDGDAERALAELRFGEATHLRALGTKTDRLRAIEVYRQTLETWRDLGDIAAEATTLSAIGGALMWLGRLEEAQGEFQRSVQLYRETKDCRGLASALNSHGRNLSRMGEYSGALEALRESLELAEPCGYEALRPTINIGYVYRDLGDFERAHQYLQTAVDLQSAKGDPASVASQMAEIAWLKSQAGNTEGAWETYAEAIERLRQNGTKGGLAGIYRRRGMTWFSVGNYQNALADFRNYLRLSEQAGDLSAMARARAHLGQVLLGLGRPEQALETLQVAVSGSELAGDKQRQTLSLLLAGSALLELGRVEEAIAEQKRALTIALEMGGGHFEALTHEALAESRLRGGSPLEALRHVNQALKLGRATGSKALEGRLLALKGKCTRLTGEPDSAREQLLQSVRMARATKSRSTEAEAVLELARIDRSQGDLIAARNGIEEGLTLVEGMRSEVAEEEYRLSFFAARTEGYEFLIDVLMELHRQDPLGGHQRAALLASERSRARGLLELLQEAAPGDDPVAPDLLQREAGLRRELSDLQLAKRHLPTTSASFLETEDRLKSVLEEYGILRAEMQTQTRGLELSDGPKLDDLLALQEQLGPETMLVEYLLGRERSYVWWVTDREIHSTEIAGKERLAGLVGQAYDFLTERNRRVEGEHPRDRIARWQRADDAFERIGSELAAVLLPAELFRVDVERWVIVADGALHYLPFAALPVSDGSTIRQPLVVDREIVMAPSISVVSRLVQRESTASTAQKQLLMIADPVYGTTDPRIVVEGAHEPTEDQSRPPSTDFERLRFSRVEAEEILALLPEGQSQGVFDFEATPGFLADGPVSRYRWVHLATHAIVDSERPGLSGLVLSMVDEEGKPQNGFLRLYDLYHLDLQAELAVLSGCRTARGKLLQGEGVVGLTRGLLYAGVSRVVASVWDVQDKATRELMVRFYEHMVDGRLRPAAALRAAQLDLLETSAWNSPYYWAPFSVLGRWD